MLHIVIQKITTQQRAHFEVGYKDISIIGNALFYKKRYCWFKSSISTNLIASKKRKDALGTRSHKRKWLNSEPYGEFRVSKVASWRDLLEKRTLGSTPFTARKAGGSRNDE